MVKTKTVDPLTQKLAADRETLLARIAETERDLADAVKASGKKLAKTPSANVFVRESAVRPVVSLEAEVTALRSALEELDRRIADAPGKMSAYEASLAPLQAAISARNAVQVGVEDTLTVLYERLMALRAANETAYGLLKVAIKGWMSVGGIRATAIPRPVFPALNFYDCKAAGQLQRDCPFGEFSLPGDTSGRYGRMVQNAEPEED
jgi:hypothetical protein